MFECFYRPFVEAITTDNSQQMAAYLAQLTQAEKVPATEKPKKQKALKIGDSASQRTAV